MKIRLVLFSDTVSRKDIQKSLKNSLEAIRHPNTRADSKAREELYVVLKSSLPTLGSDGTCGIRTDESGHVSQLESKTLKDADPQIILRQQIQTSLCSSLTA